MTGRVKGIGNNKQKRKKMRFFYYDDKLHKVIRINYPANLVEAWCFSERRRVTLLYTDWKRNAGKALTTGEVCKLLNVSREAMQKTYQKQEFRKPERSYALDGLFNERNMWWSEKNVMELYEAFMSHHWGRPRKDGKITPNQRLPTRAQIRAHFKNAQTLYIQNEDGKMIPLFEQRW